MSVDFLHSVKGYVKKRSGLKRFALWVIHFFSPALDLRAIPRYGGFLKDWFKFRASGGNARFLDFYPCLFDKTPSTPVDTHYFYQAVWAFRKIAKVSPQSHVDVGSEVGFIGMLSAITKITFVDIRAFDVSLANLRFQPGSILALPFDSGSVLSLSSLSVAEHIGLGRYGDPIDPAGSEKALAELQRVLGRGGNLYLSLPVGKRRVCFNAHRVYPATEIVAMLPELDLAEFSVVDDHGAYLCGVAPRDFDDQEYANGLFHFTRN